MHSLHTSSENKLYLTHLVQAVWVGYAQTDNMLQWRDRGM
jgi:hypothetical protein